MSGSEDAERDDEDQSAEQLARETVNRALVVIAEHRRLSRQLAIGLLVEVAQRQRRTVASAAVDVVRAGQLPDA